VSSQERKWEAAAAELDSAIAGAERDALESLEAKKRELSEALAGFDGAAGEHRNSLETLFAAQRQKWADVSAELEGSLSGAERQAREIIEAKKRELTEALTAFNSIAEKQKESLDTGFADQERNWKDSVAALDTALSAQRQRWKDAAAELEEIFAAQREKTEAAMIDAERQVLEDTEGRFEEYRAAQAEELKQLDALAGDAVRLEEELRRIMTEAEDRIRSDFARFRDESAETQAGIASSFDAQVKSLRNSFNAISQELDSLKNRAYDNVSEKLKVFEDDFFADLSKRGENIERRLADWQKTMENRLAEIGAESEEKRRNLELSHTEKFRKDLAEQGERLLAELERLRDDTAAFEEGIREQMRTADETRISFREQLDRDLEDLRSSAEASVKVEIGQYALTTAETLRKRQRELEEQLKEISSFQENRNGELAEFMELTRRNIEDWLTECTAKQHDIDAAIEGSRNRMRELETENGDRVAQIRTVLEKIQGESGALRQEIFARTGEEAKNLEAAIAKAEQHIHDFTAQTRLFDRTDELKQELNRSIEDLKGDIDRLDQRKSEVAQMETEFGRIKRLYDDVNAKMTRFTIEQSRIEVMEKDVDRLLQTSRAVEEKLAQVLDTDDTLEALQVQIRRLEEALKETEEKYQRIERKNQTLDETSSSIARNFQALQDSETAIRRINEELDRLIAEMQDIKSDIEILSGDGERARAAAEKLDSLGETLSTIEKRIAQMQTAREWIARAETRLGELNKEIQDKFKLMEAVLKDNAPSPLRDKGAPSVGMRENVVKLARQGWTAKEIAANLKLSVGEVELILELAPRD
jgi:chromosome segregation ATPase